MPTGRQQGAHEFDGGRMRAFREEAKLSRATLAARTGVAATTLRNYEAGVQEPLPPRVKVLAKGLGVRPEDLLVASADEDDTLRQLRIRAGLRQADVAEWTGIRRTSYAAVERGEVATLSGEDCAALAKVFGASQRVVRAAQAASRAAYLAALADR
jgi:transcriptional regulator with XRE-family HTH domain